MSEVDEEVQAEVAAGREIDEDVFAERVHAKMKSKGIRTKQLHRNDASLETANASPVAKKLSNLKSMADVRKNYAPEDRLSADMLMCDGFALEDSAPRRGMSKMSRSRAMPEMARMAAPMPMSAPVRDDYNTVEDEITYEQSARMVQKSIARNFAKKK